MRSHPDATVTIQTSAESVLSPPSWFGEVVLLARYLPRYALAYFSCWFSARLPAWKKPGSDEGTRSPRMNPIRKEGVG
jgi:hypothetical protein